MRLLLAIAGTKHFVTTEGQYTSTDQLSHIDINVLTLAQLKPASSLGFIEVNTVQPQQPLN